MKALAFVAAGALALHATPASRAGTQVYNLGVDFSFTQNPAGPWAYTYDGVPIPTPFHSTYLPEIAGWTYYSNWDAAVAFVVGDPTPDFWHDVGQGDVIVHVASSGYLGPVTITWTAPADGEISVAGDAWDALFDPGRDASWTLTLAGTTLARRDSIYGLFRTDEGASFDANLADTPALKGLPVSKGDVLAFVTQRNSQSGHFMGVLIGITFHFRPSCPGDTNGDGVVDFVDLNRALSSFGAHEGDPEFIAGADLNDDYVVDFLDLNIVLSYFGQSC